MLQCTANAEDAGADIMLCGVRLFAWRAPHVFLGGLCFFFCFFSRTRTLSFYTFRLTLNNDINQNSLRAIFPCATA